MISFLFHERILQLFAFSFNLKHFFHKNFFKNFLKTVFYKNSIMFLSAFVCICIFYRYRLSIIALKISLQLLLIHFFIRKKRCGDHYIYISFVTFTRQMCWDCGVRKCKRKLEMHQFLQEQKTFHYSRAKPITSSNCSNFLPLKVLHMH